MRVITVFFVFFLCFSSRALAEKVYTNEDLGAAPSDTKSEDIRNSAALNDIGSIQQKMKADPGIMSKILSLQNDPDFQEMLRDPEVIQAVQSGNIAALMSNPKFMKLLEKQAVQEIKDRISQ